MYLKKSIWSTEENDTKKKENPTEDRNIHKCMNAVLQM